METIREEQAYLKSFKHNYIDNYIKHNFGTKSHRPWSDIDRPCNGLELKEMSRSPFVTIGNHTHNHSILTICTKEEIKEEFIVSNKALYDLTGNIPIATSFPNGNYNRLVLDVAEDVRPTTSTTTTTTTTAP